jgi:CTP synthase
VVGKYLGLQDAYKSVFEALVHGGIPHACAIDLIQVDAEALWEHPEPHSLLAGLDGILVPGGFGDRGIEGKILAARYAREKGIPYYGLCLGLQVATIEFARHVAGLQGAHSTEFDPATAHPVIDLMPDQKDLTQKGASMRLGSYACQLTPGTRAHAAYGQSRVWERHRHRYEFNNAYRQTLEAQGLVVAGVNPERNLVEIVELADHPWFVGVQFHPEFQSKPHAPHPLFQAFVGACLQRKAAV